MKLINTYNAANELQSAGMGPRFKHKMKFEYISGKIKLDMYSTYNGKHDKYAKDVEIKIK